MPKAHICQECGTPMTSDATGAFCPACVLEGALRPEQAQSAKQPGANQTTQFGDYELIEEIARGGMGVVHKARQKSLDRIVAIKMLLFGQHASADLIRRFKVEAVAAGSLHHPNIVAIHEVGIHDGQHFIVMDYVDGPNLAKFARGEPLNAKRAAGYVKTIAEAIHYSHEQGILHRDLKPSNVLIDSNDEPRVTDFGLARRIEGNSSLTLSGQVVGSPGFMPPEQAAADRGRVRQCSDVYGLGAILYYLLVGRPPFQGENIADTVHQVVNNEPVSPRLLNPGIPVDLHTICLKCLEKEPARRYATANELAEELGRFLDDRPIIARPISRPEKLWRWCARNPVVSTLAAVSAILVVAIAVGSPVAAFRINRERQRALHIAAEETRQRQRAEGFLTRLEMQKAQELLAANDTSGALVYLARVLRDVPGHRVAAERLAAALTQRPFAVPALKPFKHNAGVTVARFSKDGGRLLTAAADGRIGVWDAQTGLSLHPLFGSANTSALNWAEFSPHGDLLVSAAHNGTARIWVVETGQPLGEPLLHDGAVHHACFSPDGQYLLTASHDQTARVWNIRSGALVATFEHDDCIRFARFSPGGQQVVTASLDGTVRIWRTFTGELMVGALRCDSPVNWADFSPNGRWIVTAPANGKAQVWDAQSGSLLSQSVLQGGTLTRVVFSPDGRWVASASLDTTAWIWNARTGEPIGEPMKHNGPVYSIQFSSDGLRVVTASQDKTARIWDALTGQPLSEKLVHGAAVEYAEFSPDGRRVITASADGLARIWEVPIPPASAAKWLPALAEAQAGQQLTEERMFVPVSAAELTRWRERFSAIGITDPAASWAQWYFADPVTRPTSPGSALTMADYVRNRIEENTTNSVQEALRLAPSNTLALARMAGLLIFGTNTALTLQRARDYIAQAAAIAPDDPEVWKVQLQLWDRAGEVEGSIEVIRHLLERYPQEPLLWEARARLLQKSQQFDGAYSDFTEAITLATAKGEAGKEILKRVLLSRSRLLHQQNRVSDAHADTLRLKTLLGRNPDLSPNLVDLSLHYNSALTENRYQLEADNDLSDLPSGVQRLAETDFNVRGIIQLYGRPVSKFPVEVNDITVDLACRRLHFLHGTGWSDPEGTTIASIIVHYADGQTSMMPIVYGKDVLGWWGDANVAPLEHGPTLAWTGKNPAAERLGKSLRLFKSTWVNPRPEVQITNLDYRSEKKRSAPFLIAITAEP